MLQQQTIDGMKEWLNEETGTPGGHYFLTPAEVKDILATLEPCEWKEDSNEFETVWETSCGELFVFIDGSPTDNHLNFCAYCGRKLTQRGADSLKA